MWQIMAFSWYKITLQIMLLMCEMCSNSVLSCRMAVVEELSIHPERLCSAWPKKKLSQTPSQICFMSVVNPLLLDEKSQAAGLSGWDYEKNLINTKNCSTSKDIRKKRCQGCKGRWVESLREMFSTRCVFTQIQMEIKLLFLREASLWQHLRDAEQHKVHKKDKWCHLFTSANKAGRLKLKGLLQKSINRNQSGSVL